MKIRSLLLLTASFCVATPAVAQSRGPIIPVVSNAAVSEQEPSLEPSWQTRQGARTLEFSIPAPRGQIVDRAGRPLAQNRIGYFPALQFPHFDNPTDDQIAAFGAAALEQLNQIAFGGKEEDKVDYWLKDPQDFIDHYHHRRWMPYLLVDRFELTERQKKMIESDLTSYGLVPHPVYLRHYPRGKFAGHIIGYAGLKRPMPTGPIEDGDPLFFEWEGKAGLEASLDQELSGSPGRVSIIFDANGNEIQREMFQHPVAGKTIVTTLDANMQDLAEDILYYRSSMVVMDSNNGDILAMASHPGFNPNDFIPKISTKDFQKLIEDPANPMFGRAFQAGYPPASTFKVPIALAALKEGSLKLKETIPCPGVMKVGAKPKHNWHKSNEGRMNLQKAIARSCNTWFYTVGIRTGSEPLIREARNFGFGQLTGIPLQESPGLLPTNAWMMEHHNHRMYSGDIANFAIGQGFVEATPLQVAQAMTGIASGTDVWRARLVKQIQNERNDVVEMPKKESIGRVEVSENLLKGIRDGMRDVVHAGYGTGRQGFCPYATVAAKTGTAEWKGKKKMTWFAGFVPHKDPQYTFAIAYEGGTSGGKTAAPFAKKFFTSVYGNSSRYPETRRGGGTKQASETTSSGKKKSRPKRTRKKSSSAPPKRPVVKPKTVPAKPKKKGFFRRIFGGG